MQGPNRIPFLFIFVISLFFISSEASSQTPLFEVSATKYLMGTKFDIVAIYPSIDTCKRIMYHAFKEVERIEHLMSSFMDSSEISRINRSAGKKSEK